MLSESLVLCDVILAAPSPTVDSAKTTALQNVPTDLAESAHKTTKGDKIIP